ncbi:Moderate conductance mechanosensitive channel YbiO [Ascidiaceihabitans donghaensis]|uniref:Moderate conductance mechanosensitive channel YbiO n=1 Tax=Ascidiaceihabitans donghaensis TaxID=1510460 RepID=A0A2R8BAA3_9RHOB|nr:mechanosensitive ion channel family protein [Ascidiaceihabitans donghaensis]SPH19816.1 Moderate conductance mechanosensitive channel YbiO [Ascidiaceihabitans donghaensis]
MRSLLLCLATTFLLLTMAIPGAQVSAQSLFSLPASEADDDTDALADTLRLAAENGLGVVVVDTQGNIIVGGAKDAQDERAQPRESALMMAQAQGTAFRGMLRQRLQALPDSLNEVAYILRATSADGRIMTFVEVLLYSALLFGVGRLVMVYFVGPKIFRNFVTSRIKEKPAGYREKMPFLVFRFFVGIFATLISMAIAYVLGALIFPPVENQAIQVTILAIYVAFFAIRTIGDVWRMMLSPFLAQYRIPNLSDRDALVLYRWVFYVAALDIGVVTFATWIKDFGLNYNVYAIGYGGLALIMAALNICVALFNRRAISNAIRNGRAAQDVAMLTRLIARFWAPVVIIYVVFGWFELAFDLVLEQPLSIPLVAGAYAVFMTILIVYGVINFGIEAYFQRARRIQDMNAILESDDDESDMTAAEVEAMELAHMPRHKMGTFEELARRVSGILAFVAGSYALISIWGSSAQSMVEENPLTQRVLDVMVIVFIGYIVFHAFRIWIDAKILEEQGEVVEAELGDEGGGTSASRLATLLPLFRNFMLIIIFVTIILIILLELGVNVGPLFAGAGVVGVAVGFGSQSLVRDIFSGAFFLFDDAFRKGEYIDIGGVKGTVENISVRSFQLRHHLGALHTIPFGEIQVLTNYSRDWVIMKLPLRVTYDTDVEKVRKLIKKLGVALLEDPIIGPDFIQPLKSQGVIEMQDSAMIIRVKFMTKPGDQWVIRKKVYQEIRELFEREGIKFAHKEVTVRLADGNVEDLTPEQRKTVTAAAHAAIDDDLLEGGIEDDGDDR